MTLYKKYWNALSSLKVVAIVAVSPRPGVDFFQSLFDGHKQIITFDGWLMFHEFYLRSYSIFGTTRLIAGETGINNGPGLGNINARNFFYEFAWAHLYKFDSRYDELEAKNCLGKDRKEYNFIDIDIFVDHAVKLIKDNKMTSKNAFLATYGAFALARGENLFEKKIIAHQVHFAEHAVEVHRDFPKLKIIACVRDPRIVATTISKWNKEIGLSKISILSAHSFFSRMVNGFDALNSMKSQNIKVNVLEELHNNPKLIMKNVCDWLSLDFNDILLKSTWNKKLWYGDILSSGIEKFFDPSRYEISQKKWDKDLSVIDKIVIESLMRKEIRLNKHVKDYSSFFWVLITPLLILFPTRYEVKFFFLILKKQKFFLYKTLLKVVFARYYYSFRKIYKNIFNTKNKISRF